MTIIDLRLAGKLEDAYLTFNSFKFDIEKRFSVLSLFKSFFRVRNTNSFTTEIDLEEFPEFREELIQLLDKYYNKYKTEFNNL